MAENKVPIAKAYVEIIPSMEGSKKAIAEDLGAEVESSGESGGKKFGAKFAQGLGTAAKAVGAAAVAATSAAVAGVVTLTKEAVASYGEYEQLVGGVEKLFGDSADIIQENASKAFATAGMSANEYMETVTGFSASLINSLGGDTEAAAALADQAIRDMSDNANTFGTDMETVMGVYGSLSKGMYTTLDNLKLGFAGTKEGAMAMVEAAEAADSSFTAQRDEAGNLTLAYSDLIKAIGICQTSMNITGTTSNEAASTIQGSIGMLDASWQNLITGLGDSSADLGPLIDSVVSSALSVVGNIAPIAKQAATGIAQLITGLAPVIEQELPGLVQILLPAVSGAVLSLVGALSGVLPQIMGTLSSVLTQLIPMVITLIPILASGLFSLVEGVLSWLQSGNNIQMLVDGIVSMTSQLVEKFALMLPVILPAIVKIISSVAIELTKAENVEMLIQALLTLVGALIVALIECIPEFLTLIGGLLVNAGDLLADFFGLIVPKVADWIASIVTGVKNKFNDVKNFITNTTNIIKTTFTNWLNNIKTSFTSAFDSIKSKVSNIMTSISGFVTNAINKFKELPSKIVSVGRDLISGLWNGISDKATWVYNKISNMGTTIINKVKGIFGVHSPSTVFAGIGEFLSEGLGLGFENKMKYVQADMLATADDLTASMSSEITAQTISPDAYGNTTTYNGGSIYINVYGAEGQSEQTLAEKIAEQLEAMTRRKGAVYA